MTVGHKTAIGVWLVIVGAFWFVFDLLWMPPLLWIFLLLHVPERLLGHVWPAEFVLSSATMSVGVLLLRSREKKLSVADFLVVLGCSALLVLGVFFLFYWMR